MKNIITFENMNQLTISSMEVAKMLGKEHKYLLRELEGNENSKTVGIIPALERAKFALSKYFIKDSYFSGTRSYKCYQITRLGCELIGNKQQGEKGILFTAAYVERFNEMEQALKNKQSNTLIVKDDLNNLVSNLQQTLEECKSYYKINCVAKHQYCDYIKKRLGILRVNKEYEQVKARLFTILGVQKWEDISHYNKVNIVSLIDESIKVIKSERKYEQTIMEI